MGNVSANDESIWVSRPDGGKSQIPIKPKKVRRGGQRHKAKNSSSFSVLGNNCAGIKAKKDSLKSVIKMFNTPSCVLLQETK